MEIQSAALIAQRRARILNHQSIIQGPMLRLPLGC